MKVLQINTVCGRGSTGRIVTDIAELIIDDGGECKIAYGRYDSPRAVDSVKIETTLGNYVHAVKTRFCDRQGFASKKATKKLLLVIEEYRPDIIHIHNLHGYYVNVKILFEYLSKKNIPVVWTIHDCWSFTGHCVYYDYVGCDRWKDGCHNCVKKRQYPESIFIDNSKKNYKQKRQLFNLLNNLTVVAVSDWLKGQIEQSFMKKHKIIRIYNGIDRNIFKPTDSNLKETLGISDKYIILGVADSWSERKGVSYFIELAKKLEKDEVIIMIGLNADEIKALPKGIIGFERTDSVEELVKFYSAADVVLNPSYEETFGLVTAEALCCGTPVVVLNATASPELIDDTCGRIVEKGDYEGIKDALKQIKEQMQKGIINRESCVTHSKLFDKRVNYKLYLDLYKEIIERNQNYAKT